MSHNLAKDANGLYMFAFNNEQDPWHRLGNGVPGEHCTLDMMLAAANADFKTRIMRVIAADMDTGLPVTNPDGSFVYVDIKRCTVADWESEAGMNGDGTPYMEHNYRGLSTVGTDYHTTDNRVLAERALAIAGASEGAAVVKTVGVLDNGRRFFVTLDLPLIVLDLPDGVKDGVQPYLSGLTSHDGTTKNTFITGATRIVCANTERVALGTAATTFKASHTRFGMDFDNDEARNVLNLAQHFGQTFKARAEQLASIPADMAMLDRLNAALWPIKDDASNTVKKNAGERLDTLRALFKADQNAGLFGENGWTLVNTIGEYLDHGRIDTTKANARKDMALTAMNPDSWTSKLKDDATKLVLAGV